jgi:transcriptional regulator with XRE-family HTH domain
MEKVPLTELPSLDERGKLRKAMGLSYSKAASEIGVSARSVWRWEHEECALNPENHRAYQRVLKRWKEVIENFS